MKKYIALLNLAIAGEFIRENATIELSDEKAKPYLDKGLIKLVEIFKEADENKQTGEDSPKDESDDKSKKSKKSSNKKEASSDEKLEKEGVSET